MEILDQLTCLLRNLYTGQDTRVRTRHGAKDWFQTGKGVHQGCILSPCLFDLYAEYIMQNVGLDEAQSGSRVLGEMSVSSDMQMTPPLWQKVKRNWRASWWKWKRRVKKAGLNLNIQNTKIMASGPITAWQIDGETMETVTHSIFGGSKITADGDCCHEMKRALPLGRKAMTNLVKSGSHSILSNSFVTPWTIKSMEFSRPEHWSG